MNAADDKRFAPATGRNREPILQVLRQVLPQRGTVLEIASGTGEHALYFAAHLPHLLWQPSDGSAEALASIRAWRDEAGTDNLLSPLHLDAGAQPWPVNEAAAIVNINMIHISPWSACQGLLRGAERVLAPGGVLYLYGPFRRHGRPTAPSNQAFDEDLRQRDPAWGVRDLDEVVALAAQHGLDLAGVVEMPANNLSVVLRRASAGRPTEPPAGRRKG